MSWIACFKLKSPRDKNSSKGTEPRLRSWVPKS